MERVGKGGDGEAGNGILMEKESMREGKGEEKRTKRSANYDEDTLQHGVGAQGFHGLYGYSLALLACLILVCLRLL